MTELPNRELRDAIKAAAIAADVADPVFATAKAIEAFTKGEFADADQVVSWFDLQRVKQPKLFDAPDADTNGADRGAPKIKGVSNPWAATFKGTDKERHAAIEAYIKKFGTASASRMAASAGTDIGRPLRA